MRIIAKKTLRDFWEDYPDSQEPLETWFYETLKADWATPQLDEGCDSGQAHINIM